MFSTKRLILRPFIETDLDELLALWNDPAVARTLYHDCPIPRSPKYKDFLKSHAESSFFYLIITSKETGEFMGWTNIGMPDPNNRDGILTIGLLQKFWDRGYGSEVVNWIVDYGFRRLALHRMSLTASVRIYLTSNNIFADRYLGGQC